MKNTNLYRRYYEIQFWHSIKRIWKEKKTRQDIKYMSDITSNSSNSIIANMKGVMKLIAQKKLSRSEVRIANVNYKSKSIYS